MAASGGVWAPVAMRLLRSAAANASKAIRHTFPNAPKLQPAPIRSAISTGRHPIHPAALLRQRRSARWSSTKAYQHVQSAARRWMSSGNTASASPRFDRTKFPTSNTSRRVAQGTGRAPFASTLRPNLTGGTLCRTQGGYSTGGGARYFSHTPAAPAQVVQNVGVAMRAFFLSGQKARFDGLNERGDKRYRAVSTLEHEAGCRLAKVSRFEPGSFVDFQLSPTVTALSPLAAAFPFRAGTKEDGVTLNRDGFLDVLSEDFGRALKDLTAVFADLKRLAVLGDLPVTLEKSNIIRVRFPGVDAATAERLCDDVGLQRGAVYQDPEFNTNGGVQVALKFPFAPDSQASEKTMTSPGGTLRSLSGLSEAFDDAFVDAEMAENPWLSDPEGYESMSPPPLSSGTHCSQEFDGLEGIYRFMEECDRAKGRY
ncbi:conserved hypothetical protein [Verticillium alfalfae VaMs.102]|uniref:Casein kinase II beta 2 subunit n=1 Tax=Verticillium alfalfae (strain VaMs.102 / ATCC MYA-4576 / FGSC 10136) TaxID=526221 RepID=C9SMI7_VERA1|nr:conserved hypothetical protein [Verticillium alfalfae VaMs.102]EEY20002.1 conserved hypothetical protein [Verticillium alfalfae VaMs.102]